MSTRILSVLTFSECKCSLVFLLAPQLSKTNFSNNNDFRAFLQTLCATFKVFKLHEQIENECIIDLLQQRSRTIYNVHSDNKLSEMLSLFEKGLRSVKVGDCGYRRSPFQTDTVYMQREGFMVEVGTLLC